MCGGVLFFKERTAYVVRISVWSSDVCSSDLAAVQIHRACAACLAQHILRGDGFERPEIQLLLVADLHAHLFPCARHRLRGKREHAAGRERGEVVAAAAAVVLPELRLVVKAHSAAATSDRRTVGEEGVSRCGQRCSTTY